MKKTIVSAALVILLLTLIFSLDAFAQREQRLGKAKMCVMIEKKLDLTKDQQAEIEKLRDIHQKSMIDYQAEMKKLLLDVKNLWKAETPDKEQIEAAMDNISALRSKIQKERLAHWFDVYNLLDDKQKETFKEMRQKFGEGKFQRMHKMRCKFR
jgi:Spy/CpxP family protein refolding chaperone